MGICGNSSSHARGKDIQLASKLNTEKLEIEELHLTVMQKDVAVKAMTKAIVELKKRVACVESEKG